MIALLKEWEIWRGFDFWTFKFPLTFSLYCQLKTMANSSLYTILGSTGNIGTFLAKDLKSYTDNIRLFRK